MPYILKKLWPAILTALKPLVFLMDKCGWVKGHCVAVVCEFAGRFGIAQGGTRYDHLSAMVSLLADAHREAQRLLDAYEDLARSKNGDVPAYAELRGEIQQKWCDLKNNRTGGDQAPAHVRQQIYHEPGQ